MPRDQWCFCTLALGEVYCRLARQVAADLASYGPGLPFVVLTDNPLRFCDLPNVQPIYHRQRSVLGYNDKLSVIKRAIDQYRTAVFIDADARILGPIDLSLEIFRPGLSAFLLRPWAYMQDTYDTSPHAPQWQQKDLRMLARLRDEFDLCDNGRDVPSVVESLFAVTAGDTRDAGAFLRKWNYLAEFCEGSKFFLHEGFSIGLAARLAGFPIEQSDFAGLRFFEPRLSRSVHVPNGSMTEEEYNTWNATITRYRVCRPEMPSGWATARAIRAQMRYLRVKLFGLDLID